MATTIAPGIRRTRTSWQVFARVRGQFVSKRYPLDTPLEQLRAYREHLRARARLEADTVAVTAPSLAMTLEQYYAGCALIGAISGGMTEPELIAQWSMEMGTALARLMRGRR